MPKNVKAKRSKKKTRKKRQAKKLSKRTTTKKSKKSAPKKAKKELARKTVWKISPQKHSMQDVWVFKKGRVTIVMRQNFRFGYCLVGEKPNLTQYNPDKGVNIGKFNYIDFERGDDSFGYDWTFPDDFPLEDQERIESLWQEGYHDAMEEAGWRIVEEETYVFGDLTVEEVEAKYPHNPV